MSTKQERIAELARQSPRTNLRSVPAFTSLAYLMDLDWLIEAYRRTRKNGAEGVDGVTAAEYEQDLLGNLQRLLDRVKSGTYQAPPVRRVHIPKGNSQTETRPDQPAVGARIPCLEDKILQRAVVMLLEPIYEHDFLDCSHGFRPKRSAHKALQSLRQQTTDLQGGYILEVDIRKFFDHLDHGHLREFLRHRVRDGVLLRLIGKWLKAGVMEDGNISHPDTGTPQGGVVAPPTKVQNFLFASILRKKGEVDAVDDADLIGLDDDAFNQRAEDLSTRAPVGLVQIGVDCAREAVEACQSFAQGGLLTRLRLQVREFSRKVGEAFSRALHAWLKFLAVNHAIRVGVDQSIHRSLCVTNLLSERPLSA